MFFVHICAETRDREREWIVSRGIHNQYHLFLCFPLFFLICCCFCWCWQRRWYVLQNETVSFTIWSILAALFTTITTLFYYLTKRLICFFVAIFNQTELETDVFVSFVVSTNKEKTLKKQDAVLFPDNAQSLFAFLSLRSLPFLNFVHAFSEFNFTFFIETYHISGVSIYWVGPFSCLNFECIWY